MRVSNLSTRTCLPSRKAERLDTKYDSSLKIGSWASHKSRGLRDRADTGVFEGVKRPQSKLVRHSKKVCDLPEP